MGNQASIVMSDDNNTTTTVHVSATQPTRTVTQTAREVVRTTNADQHDALMLYLNSIRRFVLRSPDMSAVDRLNGITRLFYFHNRMVSMSPRDLHAQLPPPPNELLEDQELLAQVLEAVDTLHSEVPEAAESEVTTEVDEAGAGDDDGSEDEDTIVVDEEDSDEGDTLVGEANTQSPAPRRGRDTSVTATQTAAARRLVELIPADHLPDDRSVVYRAFVGAATYIRSLQSSLHLSRPSNTFQRPRRSSTPTRQPRDLKTSFPRREASRRYQARLADAAARLLSLLPDEHLHEATAFRLNILLGAERYIRELRTRVDADENGGEEEEEEEADEEEDHEDGGEDEGGG